MSLRSPQLVCNRSTNGWSWAVYTDASGSALCSLYGSSRGVPPLINTAYRLPGSGRAHRFSPCDKKSFSTASWPILVWSSLISPSLFSAFLTLSEKTPAMLSIAWRFHVLTCVGRNCRLAAIYWTVLSPRSTSSATAPLNWSEKFRRFVILVSILSCWIHLSTLSNFLGPLQRKVSAASIDLRWKECLWLLGSELGLFLINSSIIQAKKSCWIAVAVFSLGLTRSLLQCRSDPRLLVDLLECSVYGYGQKL